MKNNDLSVRLAVFADRGLVARIPTRWQVMQGAIEMTPYTLTPDPSDRQRYADAVFGHPLVRTPLLTAYTFGGHFINIGSGLRSSERSVHKHLFGVHHDGQPVYDLQLAQTFPDGLERLRLAFLDMRRAATLPRRLERALVDTVVPRWNDYCDAMLDHIDRASQFEYDPPPAWCRSEFWSLTSFMTYCAETFPPTVRSENPLALFRRLVRLATRKFRDAPL